MGSSCRITKARIQTHTQMCKTYLFSRVTVVTRKHLVCYVTRTLPVLSTNFAATNNPYLCHKTSRHTRPALYAFILRSFRKRTFRKGNEYQGGEMQESDEKVSRLKKEGRQKCECFSVRYTLTCLSINIHVRSATSNISSS
jgi:hypothetical protein